MTLRIVLCALLLLLPFSAAVGRPPAVDLAAPEGTTLAQGVVVDGACVPPVLQGILAPGSAVVLGVTPDCRVVPLLSCPPEADSDACVDVRANGLPAAPDAAEFADCLRGAACDVPAPRSEVSVEPGDLQVAPLPWGPCANYARWASVETVDTEIRVDWVWEAGCGPQAEAYYGLGRCLTKSPRWVLVGCPHVHEWSGWEVAHVVTGTWYHWHPHGAHDGHHTNAAGVHGDNSGRSWCSFDLEFNDHSNVLVAKCGIGRFV